MSQTLFEELRAAQELVDAVDADHVHVALALEEAAMLRVRAALWMAGHPPVDRLVLPWMKGDGINV